MSLPAEVFFAISQEPTFCYVDPSGLSSIKHEVVFSQVVVGVYSTPAKAEAALDQRLAQFGVNAEPISQFDRRGSFNVTRDVSWRELTARQEKHGDQTCWQSIARTNIDAIPF